MTTVAVAADPVAKPAGSWRAELGSLIARGAGEDDERVRAARAALAYWRVRRVLDREAGGLCATGVDLLVAQLLGVAR